MGQVRTPSSTGDRMSDFARTIYKNKYAHLVNGRKEEWPETAERVARCVMRSTLPHLEDRIRRMITERKFIPGGRYLYAAGRRFQQLMNCFLFKAEDSREGWSDLVHKTCNALMTGGGIGIVYTPIRPFGFETKGMGGIATGPCSLAGIINEQGRRIMQGGSRRSAIWAGLHWWHPDIMRFIHCKDWSDYVRQGKRMDYNYPAEMDMTNISVILDDDFFDAYHNPQWVKNYSAWGTSVTFNHAHAHIVYHEAVKRMLKTGEPGFSIDVGPNNGESCRNACTESTSRDDSDVCDLGSLNLARYESFDEFAEDVAIATAFLLCGTCVTDLPIASSRSVMNKNRRIGLGFMGVHEWLLQRGYSYGPCQELAKWMTEYARSRDHADRFANELDVANPIATRAGAPNGTIAIVAETTSCLEPILAIAQKRRYLDGQTWKAQYIVDPTAHRLIQGGMHPKDIETAHDLALNVHRRIEFQAWMQQYVDQGISSTINLPSWNSEVNNPNRAGHFAETLLQSLPKLRGITCYPDGARDGQPLNPVPYEEAVRQIGVEFVDQGQCLNGVCGS